MDLLRFRETGHNNSVRPIEADILEAPVFFAEGEVRGWRVVKVVRKAEPWSSQPDAHQALRVGVRQRLQQYAIDHGEYRSIGSDSNCQCNQRNGSKSRSTPQATNDVFEFE